MQKSQILLLLIVSISLSQASYELIELGLTVDMPNCGTTEFLLKAAAADTEKLINFKDQLEKRLSFLESSHKEAKKACDKIPEASENLITVSSQKAKKAKKSLLQFNELLHPVTETSSTVEKDVSARLESASIELAQLYSKDYQNAESCSAMKNKIEYMMSYLQTVIGQVDPVIDKILPDRIENIENLHTACHEKAHTHSGNWSMNYENHKFSSNSSILRTEDYNIAFEIPFAEAPSVAIAIKSFEMDKSHPGVSLLVTDANERSFTFRVFAYPEAKIRMLEISWLATVSSMSGIYISSFSVDYKEDPEWSQKYKGTTERKMSVRAFHPVALENAEIVLGLSAFNFEAGADSRVSIEAQNIDNEGAELVFRTWWNTTMYSAEVNTIHFSKNKPEFKTAAIQTVQGGALYNAVGDRKEENKILVEEGECPLYWFGLKSLDIKSDRDYKLKIELEPQEVEEKKMIDLQVSTWDDCGIWQVVGSLFYISGAGGE